MAECSRCGYNVSVREEEEEERFYVHNCRLLGPRDNITGMMFCMTSLAMAFCASKISMGLICCSNLE